MATERVIRVLSPDGETTAVELIQQDGGAAAIVRVSIENFHTPETLDLISAACSEMASNIRKG